MKIIKSDGTIEEGIGITDAQAAEMQHIEETLHIVLCQCSYHYDWQGMPKCKKVAYAVALGGSWMGAMEDLLPKPVPEPVPDPELESVPEPPVAEVPATVEKEELSF